MVVFKRFLVTTVAISSVAFGAAETASADGQPGIWSGVYLGVNGGYGRSQFSNNGESLHTRGVLGGVHGGYNFQMKDVVLGVEGDYDFSGLKGSQSRLNETIDTRVNGLGSIRARFGVLLTPRTLVFGTAGYGFGSAKITDAVKIGAVTTVTDTKGHLNGFVVGAGLEYRILDNVSLRGELLQTAGKAKFSRFGPSSETINAPTTVVRGGLSYHFN